MRTRVLLAVVAAASVSIVPQHVDAQVAVMTLSGARANQVRRQLATHLQNAGHQVVDLDASVGRNITEVASSTGASALIRGRVQRRSGRWRATLNVYDASGESRGRATASARGLGGLARQLARRLQSDLEGLSGAVEADAEPEPEPEPSGDRRRIVVGAFSGPGSARVRNQLVSSLSNQGSLELVSRSDFERAASRLGVDLDEDQGLQRAAAVERVSAYLVGTNRRGGGQWTSVVSVRNGVDGEEVESVQFQGRNVRALEAAVRRRAWSRLEGPIGETEVPPAELEEPDEDEDQDEDEDEHEDQDEDEEDEDAGPSTGGTYNAIDIAVVAHPFGRTLRYNDDIYGFLREYTLKFGPAVRFSTRWYPGAHVSDGFGAYVGLDLMWERAFGIDSTRADGVTFPTTAQAWLVGLRGRLPLDRHEFSVGAGFGRQSFVIRNAGPSTPERLNIPVVPGVNYKYLKLDIDARVNIAGGLFTRLFAGYMVVFDAGGIEEGVWFPLASAGGIEAGIELDYQLDNGLTIRLGWDVRRFFFDMNVVPDDANGRGDPWVVGGAVDQYFGYTLGIAYRH